MKQMRLTKLAIAGSTVACAVLFSFSWSEQRGVSLSVESAQARVGRPLTPVSVAGVARRQNRRAAYGYGAGAVGAGLAGGAIGAAAVAATSPYGYYGGGPGDYYGGYANRSYVTGRPTLVPRYYGGAYAAGGYYGGPSNAYAFGGPVGGWGVVNSNDHAQYIKNLQESGYDPKNDFNANGTMKAQ